MIQKISVSSIVRDFSGQFKYHSVLIFSGRDYISIQTLSQQQINALTRFISKHKVEEINLNKAESKYFFNYIKEATNLDRARILLQPVFAEGYFYDDYDNVGVIIVPRKRIIQTDEIVWEDGYDDRPHDDNDNHYNPFTRKFIEIFIEKMGLDLLLDKIAEHLSQRFPLSRGQATAIMTKVLDFPLDSGTRSFLHDLRKKIRKYQLLVAEFQEYVLENEQPELIPRSLMNELIQSIEGGNINQILEKIPEDWINRSQEDKLTEFKSILEMRRKNSESGSPVKKLETRLMMQNQPRYEFFCQECNLTREFVPDPTDKATIDAPQHHDKPMTIRIIQDE